MVPVSLQSFLWLALASLLLTPPHVLSLHSPSPPITEQGKTLGTSKQRTQLLAKKAANQAGANQGTSKLSSSGTSSPPVHSSRTTRQRARHQRPARRQPARQRESIHATPMGKARGSKRAAQLKAKKGVGKTAGTSTPTKKAKTAGAATKRPNSKKVRTPSALRRKRQADYVKGEDKAEYPRLLYQFELLSSGRGAYCMAKQAKRFVELTEAKLKSGALTKTQLYERISRTQYLRLRKIAHFSYLQWLANRNRLTSEFLDKWCPERPLEQARKEYADQWEDLLVPEDEAGEDVFANLAESTTRTTWGPKAQDMKLSKTFPVHLVSDSTCPYSKEWVKTHIFPLVASTLGEEFDEGGVKKWVRNADGKKARLFIMVHNEELVGYLYQEMVRVGKHEAALIRAYGLHADFRDKGLGSALLFVCFKALAKFPYVIADIDKEHSQSLKCVTRAAEVFGRKVVVLGRIIMVGNDGVLEWNRHPRYEAGETMEYAMMLKGAPDFAERQDEKKWPELGGKDVPATKGGESKQGGGKKKKKQEGAKKDRGRPPTTVQFRKKGAKEKEEEKKEEEMKKKKESNKKTEEKNSKSNNSNKSEGAEKTKGGK